MKPYDFSVELNFTRTYQKYKNEHIAIREVLCLKEMYPRIFCEIRSGDGFAGRVKMSYAGFSPEPGGLGYYCNEEAIKSELAKNEYDKKLRNDVNAMLEFWKTENTRYKVRAAYSPSVAEALPSDNWPEPGAAFPLYRMAGAYLDYEKLLCSGIQGMKNIISWKKARTAGRNQDTKLFKGMETALDLLAQCCLYYSEMASGLAAAERDPMRAGELETMARALRNIASERPETLREAIQLSWLYTIISGSLNYGRMDVYLGDFLARDLEKGTLSVSGAQELVNSYWKLMADRRTTWNGRVILGGVGRRNEKNADRFALLAMEASRAVKEAEPQLSLRFYKGMDESLMEKALAVIGEGRTYPILYNDDVNVEAVAKAFRISHEEAEQYVPFGCGEYVIDHQSFGTPSGIINLLDVLEITLHNGIEPMTGKEAGIKTGVLERFETFEQLFAAYKRQVEYFVSALAEQEKIEYQVAGKTAPFLFLSMLYGDCLERGKGIFAGGVRYLGGTLETYGNINTANSLLAIREAVYEKKLLTLEKLVEILDKNFEGYEKERRLLLDMPKYGNDDGAADGMAVRVHEHICRAVRDQADRVGLHSYLVVMINNSANTTMGAFTAASADGRRKYEFMANANNPVGGSDKTGLTAMLNSLVKLNPAIHAGAVQNIRLSPELFRDGHAAVKSILKTYFENGGTQAMITVVNKSDLEKAMREPEKYAHIFVRVGGFSARFIELDRSVQLEILSRTQY